MGAVVINLQVYGDAKNRERAGVILQKVAERLGFERITPEAKTGMAPLTFFDEDGLAGRVWDHVYAALEQADPDWKDLISIGVRPG